MFSVTPSPRPPASTSYDSSKHHHVQTGSTNNSETETYIDAISAMFFGHSKSGCAWINGVRLQKTASGANFRFWYCFYFRFVPDAVFRSRILSKPVEVDRACPKTLPQPLGSPWYRFLSQSYNYFRHPSAILKFWVKEASGVVGIYTSKKLSPKNTRIATEIEPISVSIVKLLVLPVWGSFYFRFVPDAVLQSRTMLAPVEVDRASPTTFSQPLGSPWYRFLSQSYNYFRYPSAILEFSVKEASGEVDIYTSEKVVPKT